MLGDTLLHGHARRATSSRSTPEAGRPLWKTQVADAKAGYSLTLAPLVVKDKVVVGVGGGEYGIRGFVAAYDAKSGKEAWRFSTIPGPGEAWIRDVAAVSADTRPRICDSEAWKHGGGSIWVTGSYDPTLNLTYWGVGNAGPDWNADQRPGDNLLHRFGGRARRRHRPASLALPVHAARSLRLRLASRCRCSPTSRGTARPLKAMLWANRNGNFYVLERATGRFLVGKPFVKVNWMRHVRRAGASDPDGAAGGAADVARQSGRDELGYSAVAQPAHRVCSTSPRGKSYATIFGGTAVGVSGRTKLRRRQQSAVRRRCQGAPTVPGLRRGPINTWTEAAATGAVLALDVSTGEVKWRFPMTDVTDSGILTTASDVLFTGGREGYFQALDAQSGSLLWKASLGAQIVNGPITYEVDGKQCVRRFPGLSLCVFSLRVGVGVGD